METMSHYFNSGGHFDQRTRNICALFVEDVMRRISVKFFFLTLTNV